MVLEPPETKTSKKYKRAQEAKQFENIIARTVRELVADIRTLSSANGDRLKETLAKMESAHEANVTSADATITRAIRDENSELTADLLSIKPLLESDRSGRKYLEILGLLNGKLVPAPSPSHPIDEPAEMNRHCTTRQGGDTLANSTSPEKDALGNMAELLNGNPLANIITDVMGEISFDPSQFSDLGMMDILGLAMQANSVIQRKLQSGELNQEELKSSSEKIMGQLQEMEDRPEFQKILQGNPQLSNLFNAIPNQASATANPHSMANSEPSRAAFPSPNMMFEMLSSLSNPSQQRGK